MKSRRTDELVNFRTPERWWLEEDFLNTAPFERSRSHGRRCARLLVEAFLFDPFAFAI
jgi:hypothetical protein